MLDINEMVEEKKITKLLQIPKNLYKDFILIQSDISGVDMTDYINKDYDNAQLFLIYYGLRQGLDISLYTNEKYDYLQMDQIRDGIEQGLDISVYAKPEFSWIQMNLIKIGLNQNLDVSKYAKNDIHWQNMLFILTGLENNIDLTNVYNKFDINEKYTLVLAMMNKVDITYYIENGLNNKMINKLKIKILLKHFTNKLKNIFKF